MGNWNTRDLASAYQRQGLSVPESIAKACDGEAKPTKYRSRKVVCGSLEFDSVAESLFWQRLVIMQNHGQIWNLELQPRFLLQESFRDEQGKRHRSIVYVSDFAYSCREGQVVCDVKSKATMTPTFRLKEKLFLSKYSNLRLELWSYNYKSKSWEQINA